MNWLRWFHLVLATGLAAYMTWMATSILYECRARRRAGYPLTYGPALFALAIVFAAWNTCDVLLGLLS